MNTKERQEFLAWYNQLTNEDFVFDFEQEIEEYCRSDVDILRRCCLKFKELMEKTCGLDASKYCVTIASACNRVFRQQFLSEKNFWPHPARKYSVMAIRWLSWVYHQTGNRILHALNGGEQRIDGNFVDGMWRDWVEACQADRRVRRSSPPLLMFYG